MGNRVYLYSYDPQTDQADEIDESQNEFPLVWRLLFNYRDLKLDPDFIKHIPEEDETENNSITLSCTIEQALQTLKSKTTFLKNQGMDSIIIECLTVLVSELKYSLIVADITELSWFYDSEEQFRNELEEELSLQTLDTNFLTERFAIHLELIYNTLDSPIPEALKKFIPKPEKVKRKPIDRTKPLDDEGNLIAEYLVQGRFFCHSEFLSKYFNNENDHNPLVRHTCDKCNGKGFITNHTLSPIEILCNSCLGSGCEEGLRPMFDNNEIAYQKLNTDGFTFCPVCKKSFSTKDNGRWSGLRHHCGQKIYPL